MSKKTIDINPDLFNIGKTTKTKKNREKKILVSPIISPNILKNKLLQKIKEHKNKETASFGKKNNLESNPNTYNNDKRETSFKPSLVDNKLDDDDNANLEKYTDEFNDSLNYLQSLTSQKKLNDEKAMYEKNKQKKMEELQRKTLKNHNHLLSAPSPFVNLELPESLKEIPSTNIDSQSAFVKKDDSPPWGVLKGGTKPTYRLWNKTQRHIQHASPNNALVINNKPENPQMGERERKMASLKEKIKQKQLYDKELQNKYNQNIEKPINIIADNSIKQKEERINDIQIIHPILKQSPTNEGSIQNFEPKVNINAFLNDAKRENEIVDSKPIAFKRILKKTIRRKYTLGKSKIKRSVAVLLKDQKTRKQILTAYKDLKREPINNVKKKLREHNLIKIGSSAPNDVVRQIYESAMLSGEINNTNSDILLHNLMKDDSAN